MLPKLDEVNIAIVGLGYVGLPLALAFGKTSRPVYGYDCNRIRVSELQRGIDRNREYTDEELRVSRVEYSDDPSILTKANFFIITVPTPITKANQPDLRPIESGAEVVGKYIRKGSVVVLESTVYPGVTEEVLVPIIEKFSELHCGVDWKVGYSPERTNPGDKEHTIETTVKVVSGMDEETLVLIAEVYGMMCKKGVHKAPTIKTAEAEKVIENTQRDLNIALVNELSLIFHRMGINTRDVLEAAGTKWNFHHYQPGLVGGHCISVDPYYLTHKAEELGYHPQVILAGRRINDSMPEHVADLMIKGLVEAGRTVQGSRVLVMGLTFKEDIRDTRNSQIHGTILKLQSYGVVVLGYDPNLGEEEIVSFGVTPVRDCMTMEKVDGIIIATLHRQLKEMKLQTLLGYCNKNGDGRAVILDIKSWFLPIARTLSATERPFVYKCL